MPYALTGRSSRRQLTIGNPARLPNWRRPQKRQRYDDKRLERYDCFLFVYCWPNLTDRTADEQTGFSYENYI